MTHIGPWANAALGDPAEVILDEPLSHVGQVSKPDREGEDSGVKGQEGRAAHGVRAWQIAAFG
jgi:hypothetical protein